MRSLFFDYNSNYVPSAPYLTVTVDNGVSPSVNMELSALLDSGSDACMIPISILRQINARYVRSTLCVE